MIVELIIILLTILIIILCNHYNASKIFFINIFTIFFILSVTCFIFFYMSNDNNMFLFKWIGSVWMPLAFGLALLHSSYTIGNKNTAIFFSISLFLGFLSEYLGTAYGIFFGHYYYNLQTFFFGYVPFNTPISWAIIIYICYTLTSIFFKGFAGLNPKIEDMSIQDKLGLIIILSLIDGLIAMNLDMILDPVSVAPGVAGWVWIGGGEYFGVPISNFIGWFLVAFIATFFFRLYLFTIEKERYKNIFTPYIYMYMVLLYLIYLFIHGFIAISLLHNEYVLIGVAAMLPFCLIAMLWFYIQSRLTNIIDREDSKDE